MFRHILRTQPNIFATVLSKNSLKNVTCESYASNAKSQLKDRIPAVTDPNVFGTLSKEWELNRTLESLPEEEGDRIEVEFLDETCEKTKLRTKQYADMIKELVKEKKIVEALDVLEATMVKHNAKAENYIFNLLIGACARVGFTKKAFSLFNQMKKRDLKVTGGTYTSLFNACSKSPWKEDGLRRADGLRDLMLEKGYSPNQSNYHAMIKAYGHCGDIEKAFGLVDEMLANKVKVDVVTFNFLLQACITNTEAGFRHALLVWAKMRQKRIAGDIYSYNLMLRCVRDCGLGDLTVAKEEILKLAPPLQPEVVESGENTDEKRLVIGGHSRELMIPNLLADKPHLGSVVNLGAIKWPKHRLMLVGGCQGFLSQMASEKIKPDIKTMTQLLEIIPSSLRAEQTLLDEIEKYNVKVDTDFCNILIKKRWARGHYDDAKDVIKLMEKWMLNANIMTYGVLALCCTTSEEAQQLLDDIDSAGLRVNVEILGSLLHAAVRTWDIGLVMKLMRIALRDDVGANQFFLNHLEELRTKTEKELAIKERGGRPHRRVKDKYFLEKYKKFCDMYEEWRNQVKILDYEKVHPWEQFRKKKIAS